MAAMDFKLGQFEGPLDLLLHLIEKAEMDIQDIFISEITAQYLDYMQGIAELDMETASEFLSMAATLVYIKSRALLPRPAPLMEAGEGEDPEQALIRQIREYKAFKEAGKCLQIMGEEAAKVYERLPDEYPLPPPTITITGVSLEGLYRALTDVLLRETDEKKDAPIRELRRDQYTIGERMRDIRSLMKKVVPGKGVLFTELFPYGGGRVGVIVTFMAILEMVEACELAIEQENNFSPIVVKSLMH